VRLCLSYSYSLLVNSLQTAAKVVCSLEELKKSKTREEELNGNCILRIPAAENKPPCTSPAWKSAAKGSGGSERDKAWT